MSPEPAGRVGNIKNIFAVDPVRPVVQLLRIIFREHGAQVGIAEAYALHLVAAQPAGHAGRIDLAVRTREDELLIEVADNGCGIAPGDRARLFDPFFTTKPVGEGTGLGLWITHAIVEAHGGRIEVDSRLGAGTCFRVLLPLTEASPAAAT